MKFHRTRRILQFIIGLIFTGLISAAMAFGQATSSITGVVSDPSGAVVPGARVTVTNQATGVTFTQPTNSAGVYNFRALIPGHYMVKVEAQGFETYISKDNILTADRAYGLNVTLKVGRSTQTVTVESAAPMVNTEEGRLSDLVSGSEATQLPLNGRNIYQLMQLIPGAVNSAQVDFEAGAGGSSTNINGTRLNFNGYLLDGITNKGLSGGSDAGPAPDFVQEFRIQTNDFSAQYSESAGSITDISIKSGTNQFHGDLWEFVRNDALNARNFFSGPTVNPFKLNQFGGSIGGPIKKDKLFFFAGYQGERFRTDSPAQYTTETPQFANAVETMFPNSVAALLEKNFPAPAPQFGMETVAQMASSQALGEGWPIGSPYAGSAVLTTPIMAYTDPCFLNQFNGFGQPAFPGGPALGNAQSLANRMAALVGVTNAQQAQIAQNIAAVPACAGLSPPPVQAGALGPNSPILGLVNSETATRTLNQFYNGDQYVGRIDYQGDTNRIFGRFYYQLEKDPNGVTSSYTTRGFLVPTTASFPGAAFGYVHNFSANTLNEFHAGFIRNQSSAIPSGSNFGVPAIGFDNGLALFGAYNGYPQFFNENEFELQDMVDIVKGAHSLKVGWEGRRNYENSQFNVGRPSYSFFDPLYFAADQPYFQAAGVNPALVGGGTPSLDTNIRAWRNYEIGAFIQDDWKVKKNLTLNLGLRWDYFSPHTEKYNKATKFSNYFNLPSVNCQAFLSDKCLAPAGDTSTPNGGFTSAPALFPSIYTNFGPRLGFAWDPTGSGKTSVRGGFAIEYEESFYNALSNSRWNMPYYSFNLASPVIGFAGDIVYGPTNPNGTPASGIAPTYSGPSTGPGSLGNGPYGLGFAGNIMGWYPGNPNLAYLTGIPSPDYTLPYYENAFFGIQRQVASNTVIELNYVGTWGRHLFWAEDPNRVVGGLARNPASVINPCTGQPVAAPTALLNPCFGALRTWDTSVNSNYNALQFSVKREATHGLTFESNYTYSHTLDYRSTWHALTSGGSATENNGVGESGYSLDPNKLFLEYGNSLYDVPQVWVTNVMWELPWFKSQQGLLGRLLGGWTADGIETLQAGFPFTVGARSDFNLDGIRSQRPDAPSTPIGFSSPSQFEQGSSGLSSGLSTMQLFGPANPNATCGSPNGCLGIFPIPVPGTDGTLGRNTFYGPGIAETDFSLLKQIPINERFSMQFRAEFFNLFNRTNLNPPDAALTDTASFGLSQGALDPRLIQFALKLFF
jgi:hypothetical protein